MSNKPSEDKNIDRPDESNPATKDDSASQKSKKKPASPKKYNIPNFPKQKELTPEQQAEKDRQRRRRHNLHLMKMRIRNSLFGLAIIGLLAIVLFFAFNKEKPVEVKKADEPAILNEFETILHSTDVYEIMRFDAAASEGLLDLPLPNKVQTLKEKLRLAERLLELDADDVSRNYGTNSKLDSLIFLDTLNLVYDLNDSSFRGKLFEIAQKHVSDENINIRRKSNLGLCLATTHDYSIDPTEDNFDKLYSQLQSSTALLSDDVVSAVSLGRLLALIRQSPRKNDVTTLTSFVGSEFKKSDNQDIWNLGAKLHDDLLFSTFDFGKIADQMLLGDEAALQQLERAVETVTTNPDISSGPYNKVISISDNLSQIGKDDLEQQYIRRIRDAASKITHQPTADAVAKFLDGYDKRNSLVGKEFDLTATRINGQPVPMQQLKNKVVVVMFIGMMNNTSSDYLSRLSEFEYLFPKGVEFVLCSVQDGISTSAAATIERSPGITFVTRSGAESYFEQCPVSKIPYLLVLDREHRVLIANANMDQLRTILEPLADN